MTLKPHQLWYSPDVREMAVADDPSDTSRGGVTVPPSMRDSDRSLGASLERADTVQTSTTCVLCDKPIGPKQARDAVYVEDHLIGYAHARTTCWTADAWESWVRALARKVNNG